MGIYIKLESNVRISPLEKALARLHYCYEAIRYFEQPKFFQLQNAQIWLKAPSEPLGGILKDEIRIADAYRTIELLHARFAKSFYADELFSSIVVFNGLWDLNGLKFAGFVSCNNDFAWNQAYYDVEIDAYGRGKFEDLIDVFLDKGEISELAASFITTIRRAGQGQSAIPTQIYFSIGAPEYGEVENLVALYLQDRREMVRFLYSKLRRDRDEWIKDKVAPIDRVFFVGSIMEQKIVASIFKQVLEETELIEQVGKSVTYIAKTRDSFGKFYQKFKEEVFKPASQELPEADALKKTIKKGLERTSSLG
jgi:hypothetical protein